MCEGDETMLDWIVFQGEERSVADRHVVCPTFAKNTDLPRAVLLADCLACRHLVAAGVDRVAAAMCSVDALVELD